MALMEVNDLPDLGFPEIDAEHQEVVRRLNRLYEACMSKSAPEVIKAALGEFISFTRAHFRDEEQVMETTSYPSYAEHKRQHDALLTMLLSFQTSADAGDPITNIALLELLKGWLCNHVPSEDTKLAVWYRSRRGVQTAWTFS